MKHFFVVFLLSAVAAAPLFAGFSAELSPRSGLSLKLESESDTIAYDKDLILSIKTETPAAIELTLPDLRERFSGFTLAEDFAEDRIVAGDRARQTYRWRLTPSPSAERWRLSPFAVTVKNTATGAVDSFATRAVTFPPPPPREAVSGEPEADFDPEWVRPTLKSVGYRLLTVILGLGAVIGLILAAIHFHGHVRELAMSPKDRALAELNRLLGKQLLQRGFYKAFYIELTLVIRKYIERTYAVRASRQTTQEFLNTVTGDSRFTPETVSRLAEFLNAADMIKFAGIKATPEVAEDAVTKARNYIEEDATKHTAASGK